MRIAGSALALCLVAALGPVTPAGANQAAFGPTGLVEFYRGALHLALAEGRVACAPAGGPFSAALRTLTDGDLRLVQKGLAALGDCGAKAEAGRPAAGRGDRFPGWKSAGQAHDGLLLLRREYIARAQSSCGAPTLGPGSLEAISRCALQLGAARAHLLCAISTWNGPLPATVARAVRSELDAARAAMGGVTRSSGPDTLAPRLIAMMGAIEGRPGEQVYQQLLSFSDAIESALQAPGLSSLKTRRSR